MVEKATVAMIDQPRAVSLDEFDIPRIGPDDALLEVEATGVCATDGKIYTGDGDWKMPIVPGHEVVGKIKKIGENAVDFHNLQRGDRAVVYPFIACGKCHGCLSGGPKQCHEGKTFGTTGMDRRTDYVWGGYSDYMYIPPGSTLVQIPDSLPAEVGVLISAVLGNSIAWTQTGGALAGSPLLIQGPGPQGIGAVAAADYAGASPIIVTGVSGDDSRLALAKQFGADHCINTAEISHSLISEIRPILNGDLPKTVIDVTGNSQGIQNSLDLVAADGTVVIAGLLGHDKTVPVSFDDLIFNRTTVKPVHSHEIKHIYRALELVESGEYPLDKLVTSVFTLEEAQSAIESVLPKHRSATHVKSVITP